MYEIPKHLINPNAKWPLTVSKSFLSLIFA